MRLPPLASLALLACACSSAPVVTDPLAALALAEESLQHDDPAGAYATLRRFSDDQFARPELERFRWLYARALFGIGSSWEAYQRIKSFPDDHPFSPLSPRVEELEHEIGTTLIRSDAGFLFFSSDTDDGQAVLEHFVTRYPRAPQLTPDALRLLGEKAFREKLWTLARSRYEELLKSFRDSEWVALARFRLAMSRFRSLEGPEYDQHEMRLARNELRDFLADAPESPKMLVEARDALATVREWLARHDVVIAEYYRTVGNEGAEMLHLRQAAEEFGDTAAGKEALALLPLPTSRPASR